MWFRGYLLLELVLIARATDLLPGNWKNCQQNGDSAASASDAAEMAARLRTLRMLMADQGLGAYIVPSGDFHLSEFVSGHDERRRYITGFTGSAGTAVVTAQRAALWTDGRYFLQAEAELPCDWILMREGETGVPTISDWLIGELSKPGPKKIVGICPYYIGNELWEEYGRELVARGLYLEAVTSDLIDVLWVDGRPAFPSTPINALAVKYSGWTWQDKLHYIRMDMEKQNADLLVVTALDEIAWLFNMRATDITGFVNDPFFYSYAIIDRGSLVRLYIKDHTRKLSEEPTDGETAVPVWDHLNTWRNGSCSGRTLPCVEVREYDHDRFIGDVRAEAVKSYNNRVWVSYHCNVAVYQAVPTEKVYVDNTPAGLRKATKNDVEVEGMTRSHIRDAAAVIRFMAKLENGVRQGDEWTELSAMEELSRYRRMQNKSRGDSFTAISSVGPHAAINHYFARPKTSIRITTTDTYLLDSGGQYLDGTTDITRTFLFREPTDFEKECYTRVLMGQINLALAVWNRGKFGRELDAFARGPLWEVGLIYRHGTGHGIGAYLSVHEGPGRISNYHARFPWDVPIDEYMFFSDEPGYYQSGEFGIRLENIIYAKKVETKYNFPGSYMMGFETITLVPYEPHMIDFDLLTPTQIAWLEDYNKNIVEKVGPLLKAQGDMEAYEWMSKRTTSKTTTSGSSRPVLSNLIGTLVLLLLLYI